MPDMPLKAWKSTTRKTAPMKTSVLLAISVLLAGCSSIVDHALNPKLSDLRGRKILTENVSLCLDIDPTRGDTKDVPQGYLLHPSFDGDRCPDYRHKQIHLLKLHTPIEIVGIEEHKHNNLWKYQYWFLIGKVTIKGEDVSFYYRYAVSTTSPDVPDPPRALPWE